MIAILSNTFLVSDMIFHSQPPVAVEYANCMTSSPPNWCVVTMTINHLDVKALVQELWEMWSIPSLPLL